MEKINIVLNKTLKKKGLKKKISEEMPVLIWHEAAGSKISLMTEISHINNGVLFVKVSNSIWSQQLSFLKNTLINKLNHRLGSPVIKDIKFILGFTKKSIESEIESQDAVKNIPEPQSFSLSKEERKKIDEITEIIKEDEFREKFKNILIKEAKSAKWKKEMGWIECNECTALFLPISKEIKCPLCALKNSK